MEHNRCGPKCDVCGLLQSVRGVRRPARVVAQSEAMQQVLRRAARFAPTDAPVVVLGETGSGKEVVARVLHQNSARSTKSLIAVNVAALPAELLESELFGHAKGAFTGATQARPGLFSEADGGTLFLDEIAELPMPLQPKLLRALQDGEIRRVGDSRSFAVDVRIVCATHRDLAERVRTGHFREDLYYRLKVLTLKVPPLRQRGQDILPLARSFLAEENHATATGFSKSATTRLIEYPWPGNVRELQNAVRHGAALSRGEAIEEQDLPEELQRRPAAAPAELVSLADAERSHILAVLAACGDSQSEAARVLGIGRNTLWRKLRRYDSLGAGSL
ncbi:MAG TPA: sigma-54 dependent transcriptional regulator [Polyangiaceae bacterium]|nr:sigma-54 dependent transcriptional regulator [Polyangiaceae bacterium]